MSVIIYHNSRCATSRAVLDLVRAAGVEPIIIDYMKEPPSHEEMLNLLLALDMTPRALLRTRESNYAKLGLDDPALTDRDIIDAMLAHPDLIERPIVIGEKGARLCRPKEKVMDILP